MNLDLIGADGEICVCAQPLYLQEFSPSISEIAGVHKLKKIN
jgi:hypothetical protein